MAERSRKAEALALLGLARRAGAVVLGTASVRQCLREGKALLVIVADDASGTQTSKVVPLADSRGVPWVTLGSRAEMGAAVGAGPLTAVAVDRPGFARALMERLGRA